jgi:hypothetical protein
MIIFFAFALHFFGIVSKLAFDRLLIIDIFNGDVRLLALCSRDLFIFVIGVGLEVIL